MTPRDSRLRPTSTVAVVFISALLLSGMLAAPASAATPAKKLFAANISPTNVAGCSMPYTFTLTLLNETKTQVIDAANLTAPTGFTLLRVDSLVSDGPKAKGTIVGSTVQLRSLGLQPGHTATLVFDAVPACLAAAYAWLLDVRQSNDFNGTGNIVAMDAAHSNVTTDVGDVVKCPATQRCSGSVESDTTTADVTVDPGSSDAILTVSLLPTDAIQCFEPRIIKDTLRVRAIESDSVLDTHNLIEFEISGQMWDAHSPFDILLRTRLDLEAGQVEVSDSTAVSRGS